MASNSINICGPLARPARLRRYSPSLMPPFSINVRQYEASKGHSCSSAVMCSTVQESSTVTGIQSSSQLVLLLFTIFSSDLLNCLLLLVPDKKAAEPSPAEATTAQVKPKKPPVKALPEMMAEDVIPSLKAILEAQEDLSQIEITFENNKVCCVLVCSVEYCTKIIHSNN